MALSRERDEQPAMQLAIWNIIYDTDTTILTGDFRASSTDQALADGMLTASLTAVAPGDQYNYTFFKFDSDTASETNKYSQATSPSSV